MKYSDTYYTVTANYYRGGNYQTGVPVGGKERKALNKALKQHWPRGGDTPFKTEQDALDAMAAAGLSTDDYCVCETCNVSLW